MNSDENNLAGGEREPETSAGEPSSGQPGTAGGLSDDGAQVATAEIASAGAEAVRPGLPEDLRVPWGWLDLVLVLGVLVFGGAFLMLASGIVFRAAGINLQHVQRTPALNSVFLIVMQSVLDLGLLAYLAAQMRIRFARPFWRTIGWRPLPTGTTPRGVVVAGYLLSGFLLALVVQAAAAAHPPKTAMPIEALFQDRLSAVLMIIMGVLIAPVVEETLFRGYLYPVLARSWGVTAGVLVTGVLFGWLHSFQLGGARWQVMLLMLVGILFTYVRARTRTVTSSFLLHVSYNSFQFLAFLVASHGLRMLPHAAAH